jgi:hypothetical protein
MCSDSPPTESQFAELLARPRENSALRWVIVEPPHRFEGDESSVIALFTGWDARPLAAAIENMRQCARASEFVRRLVSCKVHGADAIFVRDPFNDENGLMQANGMPAELLLPWRTTAVMLGGAEYIGQMQLPSGSINYVFRRMDGEVVMVVWNSKPGEEALFLGEDVRQFDIFGRSTKPPQQDHEQTIRVGPTPSFVLGLHEGITRWRMAVSFEKTQVPSIFAKPHANSLSFQNFYPQGVGGSFKIVVVNERHGDHEVTEEQAGTESTGFTLERWTIEPPRASFQLAAGQEMHFPFEIELRNALFGRQPVRIDFTVEADQQYQFSVYRQMEVGTEDLTLEVNSHLDKDGTLVVEQLMTNSAAQLADFKCFLRAKGHRRQRMQVYRLGKEIDRKVYRFPDGVDLIGKELLLEIEELNGPRELRHRFVATEKTDGPRVVTESSAETTDDSHITTPPVDAGNAVTFRSS